MSADTGKAVECQRGNALCAFVLKRVRQNNVAVGDNYYCDVTRTKMKTQSTFKTEVV